MLCTLPKSRDTVRSEDQYPNTDTKRSEEYDTTRIHKEFVACEDSGSHMPSLATNIQAVYIRLRQSYDLSCHKASGKNHLFGEAIIQLAVK